MRAWAEAEAEARAKAEIARDGEGRRRKEEDREDRCSDQGQGRCRDRVRENAAKSAVEEADTEIRAGAEAKKALSRTMIGLIACSRRVASSTCD